MKPRWAYIWEYTHLESGERRRTSVQVTKAEFHAMTGQFLDESDAKAIEETKVDRNVVGYFDPHRQRVPKMPKFVSPSESELREMWRTNHDPEVRRLILEVVTLRKSLQKIMDWWKAANDAGNERGVLGGPIGPFIRLYHLLREEMRRAGMM
ncbi:hypothetical protein [Burkholderia cenocepacia]|uniref:hypothetical protein n=1 Tax=Burkholderia cenocepacia TaxID=95486 RepID=UPI00048950DE|nr:hypothetical protein [Burkholderia cenocepacia]KOR22156.1 hypothetical protein ABW54_08080 [Burkholderia cenocepacia]